MSVKFWADVKLRTLSEDVGEKNNESEDDRKCFIFELSSDKSDDFVGDKVPLTALKSIHEKWLYGPAFCLKTKRIMYPCLNSRCAVPCPCLLCSQHHPVCRVPASKLCNCLNCTTHQLNHDRFHDQVWHFGCKYCKFQEKRSEQAVKLMTFRHESPKPLQKQKIECDICFKTFAKRYHMERHRKLHVTDEESSPKATCQECGKQFTRSDNLERHLKSVHGSPTHKCVDCEQTFKCFDSFLRHLETRIKQDLNKCRKCEKVFCNFKKLWAHFTAEHPILSCEYCGQTFTTKRSLKLHTDNRVAAECNCGKMYCNRKSLNNHVKKGHI